MTISMTKNYPQQIIETPQVLKTYRKQAKSTRIYIRIQILYLLKEQLASSLAQAAKMVGLSYRQTWIHWKNYQRNAIKALLTTGYSYKKRKIYPEQQEMLLKQAAKGQFANLWQAKDWIDKELGVSYTEQGVWYLLRARKIKLKSGRPKHYLQHPQAIESFKASFKKK